MGLIKDAYAGSVTTDLVGKVGKVGNPSDLVGKTTDLVGKTADLVERSRDAGDAVQKAVGRALGRQHRVRSSIKTNKSSATRERIMRAAEGLMVERGGVGFQMSEVSDLCHMSKGALYYYFSDREDLADAVFDAELDAFAEEVAHRALDSSSALDALVAFSEVFTERFRMGTPLALGMVRQLVHYREDIAANRDSRIVQVVQILSRQIERAKTEGYVRPEIDATAAAISVCGAFTFGAISAGGEADASVDDPQVSLHVLQIIMSGMGTPNAIQALDAREKRGHNEQTVAAKKDMPGSDAQLGRQ